MLAHAEGALGVRKEGLVQEGAQPKVVPLEGVHVLGGVADLRFPSLVQEQVRGGGVCFLGPQVAQRDL